MNPAPFCVHLVSWPVEAQRLSTVRRRVFIDEQGVPEALEWDEHDRSSVHALALNSLGTAIGTGRVLPDGHIGRMAVLPAWRGLGVGAAILQRLLDVAASAGHPRAFANAQVSAIGFYERAGFVAAGPVFDDAGIPHRVMHRDLPDSGGAAPAAKGR
jgi:predicted GNAT family N-acyltransferase